MPPLPIANSSLLVRADAGHDKEWMRLVSAVLTENDDGFRAYVEFVDDPDWYEYLPDQLRAALPHSSEPSILFSADEKTLTTEDFPIVVIDLVEHRSSFRSIASELWAIENNLNISNMDWEDFAKCVDSQGIFRGFV
ncbi:DUF6924 domain-containing protein [Leekyejoonella antrihumi]|uniref:DUF6924 domain-containing protein n=1 Tax=Leekyejoonella antrihumi TaxID=1660198 RepID=A0A563E516_9MICO|nr:hypothetical protein [Leekyejoonella antrihumi]TWP37291.1 hypothetical protein FGL98_05905 [Leekyejoonella antrihumi]